MTSREVYQYVMIMPAEVDPISLEWRPLLIKEFPEPKEIKEGKYKGKWVYQFEFLPEAVWSDGNPVTGYDYRFTFMTMFHKGVNVPGLKAYFSKIIKGIEVNNDDPKKFEVYVEEPGENILYTLCGVEVYPRSLYDPSQIMDPYTLEDMRNEASYDELVKSDRLLAEFGTQFTDAKYSREVVEGAGPYKLVGWETDQFVRLVKKEDYWGHNYPERIPLNAEPQEIIFQIVEDDVIAISHLKAGELDLAVLQATTGERFEELRKDELLVEKFDFYTPQLLKYYNLQLNNEHPYLSDKKVRRALAHLIDVNRLIKVVEGGNGEPAVSIISNAKPYYNSNLKPIPYNLEKAKSLLAEAGWEDSDNNGVLDKVIDGVKEEFKIRFFTTNTALGQRVALAMKEGAAEAKITIDLVTQSFRVTINQNVNSGDFEIFAMSTIMSPVDEPNLVWHSNAIGGNGKNRSRFSNVEADQIMNQLGEVEDLSERNTLFKKLQQIIYDEQPIIMLYFPVEKILVNKKYNPLITTRRPGYLANAFKPAE